MSAEFLRRLFISCSDEAGNSYRNGLNLSELYIRIEDTAEADRDFSAACKKAGLTPDVADDIFNTTCAVIRAYELQGFINGFRLCAQLGRELGVWETAT